ncbi:MAG: hypothetical protein NVS3B7_03530 [Candidatus Elarobacter sp.]
MHASVARRPSAFLAALVAVALPFLAPPAARAHGSDRAGIGVARISLIRGEVAVRRGDSGTPVAAAINAPVLGADYVTTGEDSRAEVQFDGATMVRLASNVQLRFSHLDPGDRALQLAQGTIEVSVLRDGHGRTSIDTPSITLRASAAGRFRVSVNGEGATEVTARSGEARIVTPTGERTIGPGSTAIASGPAGDPVLESVREVARDDFDRFNSERDARRERAISASSDAYGRDLAGSDDLDEYGRWVKDGPYGTVWVPYRTAYDWAPYRDGRWVWEDTYGWTWVGLEPWGWTPYHYGRWYHSRQYGWCWYPPRGAIAPIWQPALVAFIGLGGGNVAFGFGTIAWVPLAPFEPYYPAWGGNTTIVTNITTITNVTNVYDNGTAGAANNAEIRRMYQNAAAGTTAQPGKRFLEGRFDHPLAVSPAQLAHAQLVKGSLPAVPTANNLRYSDKPVARAVTLNPVMVQGLFAGDAVVVRRTPFDEQRAALAADASKRRATAQQRANASPQSTALQPDASSHQDGSVVWMPNKAAPARRQIEALPAAWSTKTVTTVPVITGTTTTSNDPWQRFNERRGMPLTAHAVRTTSGPEAAKPSGAHLRAPESDAHVRVRVDAEAAPSRTSAYGSSRPPQMGTAVRANASGATIRPIEARPASLPNAQQEQRVSAPLSAPGTPAAPRSTQTRAERIITPHAAQHQPGAPALR